MHRIHVYTYPQIYFHTHNPLLEIFSCSKIRFWLKLLVFGFGVFSWVFDFLMFADFHQIGTCFCFGGTCFVFGGAIFGSGGADFGKVVHVFFLRFP